jgi:hypothetical protein
MAPSELLFLPVTRSHDSDRLAQFILIRKVSRINVVFTDYTYPLSSILHTHVPFVTQHITSSVAIQHYTSLFTQILSSFLHACFGRGYL